MGFKMKGAPYTSGGPKNMQNVLAGKDPAQVPAKRKGAKNYGQEAETQGPLAMDPNYNGEPGVQKEDFKQFSSKGPLAHKGGHKAKAITASESRKNFETDQYRKGVGRIKEGGDSRKNKISTRTGRDKVVGSAGNKLVRGKRGSSKTVVVEKSVNKLTPKKQITKKIDKKNITKDLKSKGPLATKEERVAKRATKKAARQKGRKERGGSRVGNAIRGVGKTINKVANSKVGKIAVGTYKTVKAAKSGNIKGALVEGKKVATELATKSKGAKYHGKMHTDEEDKKRKEGKYLPKNKRTGPGGESKSKKTTVMTQKGGPSKPKKKSNKSKPKKFDPTKKSLKY